VRKKLLLLSAAVLALALVVVPAANAAYISVTAKYSVTDMCRTAPDTLSYRFQFTAKVVRSGVPKPSKVRIGYQVLDASNLQVLGSGVTNLYASKRYKAKSKRVSAKAGQQLNYHFNMSYRVAGMKRGAKLSDTDSIPSVEQMDQYKVPYC
jgi:hypothetical protein